MNREELWEEGALGGRSSWACHTFMTSSGLNWPIPPIATPVLTVPYAAPAAAACQLSFRYAGAGIGRRGGVLLKTMAQKIPACEKKHALANSGFDWELAGGSRTKPMKAAYGGSSTAGLDSSA